MKICRFARKSGEIGIGMAGGAGVIDLSAAGINDLFSLFESDDPAGRLQSIGHHTLPQVPLADVKLLPPVERQEIWAAGVTYLRSKKARMEESDFSATAYDKVYDAARPEIFFKAVAEKVVASEEPVGIRKDARWSVPEPELALVVNSRGTIVGTTIGNDMSSRDIEGENLLYLPQAKIYDRSCSLGPWILVGASEADIRNEPIRISIRRDGVEAFSGETSIGNIRRSFGELAEYLYRSQRFPHGAILLTGTGIVPPDSFTLAERDIIEIAVPSIGVLRNTVVTV